MSVAYGSPHCSLPPELIAAILDHLIDNYRSLFNLGLANRLLHEISQRLLYRKMYSIFNAQSKNRKAGIPRNSNRAMLSVLKNLSLAAYVMEYTIEDPAPLFGQSPSPIQSLRQALHAMVNLRHLNIETYSPERWKLLFDFDSHLSNPRVPFQLETISCKGHESLLTCTSSYAYLSAFLHTQHKLRRIDVQLSRDSWDYSWEYKKGGPMERDAQMILIPSSACPQLEWVIGNRAAIDALLPGRKVRILEWKYCRSDASGSIRYLASELAHLEVLSFTEIGWLGVSPPLLQMAKYMRNIQYLEVQNTDFDSLEWTFTLSSLLGVVLLDSRDRNRLINTPARRQKAVNFFDQLSTLQFIAVELPSSLKNNFELWRRLEGGYDAERKPSGVAREPEYVKYSYIQRILYPFV